MYCFKIKVISSSFLIFLVDFLSENVLHNIFFSKLFLVEQQKNRLEQLKIQIEFLKMHWNMLWVFFWIINRSNMFFYINKQKKNNGHLLKHYKSNFMKF